MTRFCFRAHILASATVSALALTIAGPALAQSGAPASGTTMDPPATGVSTGAATPTPADDGARPANSGGLVDIVVTARRTSEALQTTPVAVTALNNEALVTKQVAEVTDLARATPALSVGTGGTGPASIVYLAVRGQAQNSPNSFSDASVGIYIDGVYVGRPMVGNLGFLDMASAEVLRGPQGTLFGRNTTGGALNLTTAQPTDKLEGYVKGGIGSYDLRVVEGVLNIPLSETVATRFAGRYDQREGYFPNEYYGKRQGSVNSSYYARGTLKWTPTELPITLTISGDYANYKDNGNPTAVAAINPTGPLAGFYGISQGVQAGVIPGAAPIPLGPGFSVPASTFANFSWGGSRPLSDFINPEFPGSTANRNWRHSYGNPRTGYSFIDELRNFNKAFSGTANLVVDLDSVTIKSITGYRKSNSGSSLDLTGTPSGGGAFFSQYHQHQFSEEVQISGDLGDLDWVTGVNFFREAGDESSRSAIFYNTPIAAYTRAFGDFISKSFGIFGQVNYRVTDRLRFTGGLRYTWDKRTIDRHGVEDWRLADPICQVGENAGLPASQAKCTNRESDKFKYPAWLASVDYEITPDIFVYAKTSGASMSGGFNSRNVPPPYSSSFEPEDVRDVEVGFKGDFLNNKLRINLAAFHAWQKGVQRIINTTFVDDEGDTQLTQFVTNAGNAKTYGFEFEGTLIPWRGMTVDASAAYLHARYQKGSRIEQQQVGSTFVDVDRSGEPITQAPKWTASIGGTQELEFEPGTLKLHADYAYISNRYFDYFTTGDPAQQAAVAIANQASLIKGYGLFNGQISFTLRDPEIEFMLWGKNLGGTKWFTNVFNSYTGLGSTLQFQGAPRTYGGSIAVRF
jgi:iron complex outermembrane receptor protein